MSTVLGSVSSVGQRNTGSGFEVIGDASRGNSRSGVSLLRFFKRAPTVSTKVMTIIIMMIPPVVQAMIIGNSVAVTVVAVAAVVAVIAVAMMVVKAGIVVAAAVHILDIVTRLNSLDIDVPLNMYNLLALEWTQVDPHSVRLKAFA